MKLCPECNGEVYGKVCSCGWKDGAKKGKASTACSWTTDGNRCQMPGTVTYQLKGDRWLCTWHFMCKNDYRMATNKKEFARVYPFKDFGRAEEYWDRTLGLYTGGYKKPREQEGWIDCEDTIKGLVFVGEDSIAWAKSPETLKAKARELKQSGWKPSSPLFK